MSRLPLWRIHAQRAMVDFDFRLRADRAGRGERHGADRVRRGDVQCRVRPHVHGGRTPDVGKSPRAGELERALLHVDVPVRAIVARRVVGRQAHRSLARLDEAGRAELAGTAQERVHERQIGLFVRRDVRHVKTRARGTCRGAGVVNLPRKPHARVERARVVRDDLRHVARHGKRAEHGKRRLDGAHAHAGEHQRTAVQREVPHGVAAMGITVRSQLERAALLHVDVGIASVQRIDLTERVARQYAQLRPVLHDERLRRGSQPAERREVVGARQYERAFFDCHRSGQIAKSPVAVGGDDRQRAIPALCEKTGVAAKAKVAAERKRKGIRHVERHASGRNGRPDGNRRAGDCGERGVNRHIVAVGERGGVPAHVGPVQGGEIPRGARRA